MEYESGGKLSPRNRCRVTSLNLFYAVLGLARKNTPFSIARGNTADCETTTITAYTQASGAPAVHSYCPSCSFSTSLRAFVLLLVSSCQATLPHRKIDILKDLAGRSHPRTSGEDVSHWVWLLSWDVSHFF